MLYLQLPLTRKEWLDKYFAVWIKNWINFYGWFASDEYYKKYWKLAKMNSRHNHASFNSIDELKEAISIIEEKGHKFSYVFNSTNVSKDISGVLYHVKLINEEIKPKSVIISDLAFIEHIDPNISINISSFVWINNSFAIDMLRSKHPNVTRIIYQRDIILDDVENISDRHEDLEYEIFIKNIWCYHNGHCTSHHKDKTRFLCLREKGIKTPSGMIDKKKLQVLQKTKLDCKVCSIYRFKESFVKSKSKHLYLKIPWREFEADKVVKDAKFTDLAIEGCKTESSYKAFVAKNIHNHRKIYWGYCDYKKCEYYLTASRENDQ